MTPPPQPPVPANQHPPPKDPPPNTTPGVHKTQIPLESVKTTTYLTSNVSIEFKTTNTTTATHDRMVSLFATLYSVDDTLQVNPIDKSSNLPTITKPSEIPADSLEGYVSTEKKLRNGVKHHVIFCCASRINTLKNHRRVMSHLQKHDIWMQYHTISSSDITSTSWLSREDPDAICRHDLHKKMVDALGGEFSNFQLNARNVTYKGGALNTRAWVLEMDKANAKVWAPKLHRTFRFKKDKTSVQLIPFSAAAYAREEAIKKVFYLQNHFLNHNIVIRIDNLKGLDAPLKRSDGTDSFTLRQTFETMMLTDTSDSVFTSVCQYNSGRVTLGCKKANLDTAIETVDYLLDTWLNELEPASRSQLTFIKPPVRIGRPVVEEDVVEFETAIRDCDFELDFDNASVVSELKTPCSCNSYSGSRSYASVAGVSQTSSVTNTPNKKSASSVAATTTSEMDILLESIQKRTSALDASHEATNLKVTGMEKTLQATLLAVNHLSTSMEKQAILLGRIADQLDQIQRTDPDSPVSSPARKKQATKASKVAAEAIDNIEALGNVSVPAFEPDSNDSDSFKSTSDMDDDDLYAPNEPTSPPTAPPEPPIDPPRRK